MQTQVEDALKHSPVPVGGEVAAGESKLKRGGGSAGRKGRGEVMDDLQSQLGNFQSEDGDLVITPAAEYCTSLSFLSYLRERPPKLRSLIQIV